MKNSLLFFLPALLVIGCTSIKRLDSRKYEVISVPQGLRDSAKFGEMAQCLTNGRPMILKLTGGERMPFKLTVDLPIGELAEGDSVFVFKRDTYLLLSQKECMLSPDGQRWANISAPKSLGRLFGTKSGEVRFGFTSNTNQGPFMTLELKAK